jgi:hypothetical protein
MTRARVASRVAPSHRADLADEVVTLLLLDQARRVLRALDEADVPVLILKGLAYLGSIRPMATGRRTRDIDLLVRPTDSDRAVAVLLGAGFQLDRTPEDRLVEGHSQQALLIRTVAGMLIKVDLHWALLNLDPRPLGFTIDHEGLWSRSVPVTVQGWATRRPSDEDLLLHSCLHHAIHDVGRSSRDLLDIRSVVASVRLDWVTVVESARVWGVVTPVGWALARARRQVGADIPSGVLAALRPHGLFRLCLPIVEARTELPPQCRFERGEPEIIRRLQARSAGQAVSALLRMAWPSEAWLREYHGDSRPGWERRLIHMRRLVGALGAEISRVSHF